MFREPKLYPLNGHNALWKQKKYLILMHCTSPISRLVLDMACQFLAYMLNTFKETCIYILYQVMEQILLST